MALATQGDGGRDRQRAAHEHADDLHRPAVESRVEAARTPQATDQRIHAQSRHRFCRRLLDRRPATQRV